MQVDVVRCSLVRVGASWCSFVLVGGLWCKVVRVGASWCSLVQGGETKMDDIAYERPLFVGSYLRVT